MDPKWLVWARQLQALAQTGLAYPKDPYDIDRYKAVRRVAAEMIAAHSEADLSRVHDLLSRETGHATPKVDVRGVVFRDGTLMLVRERSDGGWTLPGGWADVGESASESVEREVWEESGYRVRAVKLLALLDRNKHPHPPILHHAYKAFFRCEIVNEGEVPSNLETDAVAFFAEDGLPGLSLDRVTPAQIARLFEHLRHPDRPADFD